MFREQEGIFPLAVISLYAITIITGEVHYRYVHGKKDFLGALQSCFHLPGKWSLQSEMDVVTLHWLKMEMEANSLGNTWLGIRIYQLDDWQWVNGAKASRYPVQIQNGTCGAIVTPGSVISVPCHSNLPFICEFTGRCPIRHIDRCASFKESVIFLGCDSDSWHSARIICKELEGDLVVINNDEKLRQIWNIIEMKGCPSGVKRFYVGMHIEEWINAEEWLHLWSGAEKFPNLTGCLTLDIDQRGHHRQLPQDCNRATHVICRKDYQYNTTMTPKTLLSRKGDFLSNALLICLTILPPTLLGLALATSALWIICSRKRRWRHTKSERRKNHIQYRTNTEETRLLNENSINIVLVGTVGSGKSSLINSFIMAFGATEYRDVALRGSYGGHFENKSKTKTLSPYMLSEQPVHPVVLKGEKFSALEDCDLTFWDMPGLANRNDMKTRRLFSNLLAGRLKSGDTASKMMSTRLCISPCCEINIKTSPICEPDIVIFVYAAHKDPPTKLATALTQAVSREVPIITAKTHIDHMSSLEISNEEGSSEPSQKEKGDIDSDNDNIRKLLGIQKCHCFSLSSYHDDMGLVKNEFIEEKFRKMFKEIKKLKPINKSPPLQGTQEEEADTQDL